MSTLIPVKKVEAETLDTLTLNGCHLFSIAEQDGPPTYIQTAEEAAVVVNMTPYKCKL